MDGFHCWCISLGFLLPLSTASIRQISHTKKTSSLWNFLYILIQKKVSQSISHSFNYGNMCEINLTNHILPKEKSRTIITICNKRKGLTISLKNDTQKRGIQSTSFCGASRKKYYHEIYIKSKLCLALHYYCKVYVSEPYLDLAYATEILICMSRTFCVFYSCSENIFITEVQVQLQSRKEKVTILFWLKRYKTQTS